MKVKLLKKLRAEARSRVTIYSVTREKGWSGEFITGVVIGYSKPQYEHIFSFGMTEEDVKKKAEKIFFETEMGWVRKKYKKYTRRYKHGN